MIGTQPDMGGLSVTLTSPAGTDVTLFNALCAGTADFDMQMDDAATTAVATSGCAPLGSGGLVIPQEALALFNGENSAGDWILTFHNTYR
ncbi:MAG: proprotein convertase P-domain-containing protein [Saprospiraceae bacterium]|nr:proprotein convertase P-domain-containing protein [Saprospiraceae bacterium]